MLVIVKCDPSTVGTGNRLLSPLVNVGVSLSVVLQLKFRPCDRGGVYEEDLVDRTQGVVVYMRIPLASCTCDLGRRIQ